MLKGWKTLVTNGLVLGFSVIEGAGAGPINMDDQNAMILGAIAVGNIVLRFVTTGPVGSK